MLTEILRFMKPILFAVVTQTTIHYGNFAVIHIKNNNYINLCCFLCVISKDRMTKADHGVAVPFNQIYMKAIFLKPRV